VSAVLDTGATAFLGLHAARALNHQGRAAHACTNCRGSTHATLRELDLELWPGSPVDPQAVHKSVRVACAGVDTRYQLRFRVELGGEQV
jgi:hypothetical protein